MFQLCRDSSDISGSSERINLWALSVGNPKLGGATRKKFIIFVRNTFGHWGDPDVDGRLILRWIFRKLEGVVGTGWSWLRIGTGGGNL
jgi:hypothetical protein